jgi:TRAP-type uncharacterized transport system substrate-binding protein
MGGAGRAGRQPGQTVYVLDKNEGEKATLRPVRIATGITDGHFTQVTRVLSGELKPNDAVVTGLATLKNPQTGNAAMSRGARPPFGRF